MSSDKRDLQTYYRWHARFYDATRWSFLFGRRCLVRSIPSLKPRPRVLEIGCGTGHTLMHLHRRYPGGDITGIDLSEAMLKRAGRKTRGTGITLHKASYGDTFTPAAPFDLILCSYSLTMMSHEPQALAALLKRDLHPGGVIAAVDFHTTPSSLFGRWMHKNHVQMKGRWLPALQRQFQCDSRSVHPAWFGLWNYFLFTGCRVSTDR